MLTLVLVLAGFASASPLKSKRAGPKNWNLFRTYEGENWFDGWDFVTFNDPTRGKTNYVDAETARNRGLAWTRGTQFGMTCDTYNIVSTSARGRDSVRIHSKDWYGEVMAVADIAHMPDGCGTWPAWWTNGQGTWPSGGEFDIIEGTHGQGKNRITLHTLSNTCVLPTVNHPGMSEYSGKLVNPNCVGGAGCSIEDQTPNSWAKGFIDNGGGWFVMRRNPGGYAVWFYPRNSATVPDSVKYGHGTIDEETLGKKVADFPFWDNLSGCDLATQFTDQQFIFNIAMGGSWAESRWASSGCKGELYDLILNKPEALSEAYWLINGMRLYGAEGDAAATPNSSPRPANALATPAATSAQADAPEAMPTPAPEDNGAMGGTMPAPEPAPTATNAGGDKSDGRDNGGKDEGSDDTGGGNGTEGDNNGGSEDNGDDSRN